jgi:hypothetical protein
MGGGAIGGLKNAGEMLSLTVSQTVPRYRTKLRNYF